MWILPTNLKSFPSALDHLESKEELLDQGLQLDRSLTWRGKLLSVSTWQNKWKRVWWMQLLFGRMLKPSMHHRFVTEYTESLEVIPARAKALPVSARKWITKDSFSMKLRNRSAQATLFSVSSKTSAPTYQDHSPTFSAAYDDWVTKLRRDCLRRLKRALHTNANDFSSLHGPTLTKCGDVWPTPVANRGTYNTSPGGEIRLQLPKAVTHWATPCARDFRGTMSEELLVKRMDRKEGANLAEQIQRMQYYPTPLASEDKKGCANTSQNSLTSMVANGQLRQDDDNIPSKLPVSRVVQRLNPEWVAQLMGTTLEATFFGCMETEWLNRRQALRGDRSLS